MKNNISITGWTTKDSIESLTLGTATEELEETKSLFFENGKSFKWTFNLYKKTRN